MSYKWLDKDIYDEFISYIIDSINVLFIHYDSIYIEDYDDDMPDNHPEKVYYACTCLYGCERDVYPIYKSELDHYFEKFKAIHRQLRIDNLFEDDI